LSNDASALVPGRPRGMTDRARNVLVGRGHGCAGGWRGLWR
jgi:hypothetical protein